MTCFCATRGPGVGGGTTCSAPVFKKTWTKPPPPHDSQEWAAFLRLALVSVGGSQALPLVRRGRCPNRQEISTVANSPRNQAGSWKERKKWQQTRARTRTHSCMELECAKKGSRKIQSREYNARVWTTGEKNPEVSPNDELGKSIWRPYPDLSYQERFFSQLQICTYHRGGGGRYQQLLSCF
jgi:hypothetical protein